MLGKGRRLAIMGSEFGFTLIELLVVVAILALLASLLLPALATAKAKGPAIRCLNNLRQLQVAWLQYAHDNDDRLPKNNLSGRGGDSELWYNWVAGSMWYDENPDSTNRWNLIDNKFGKIGGYTQDPQLYKCPSDRSWVLINSRKHERVRSYSMNLYMGLPHGSGRGQYWAFQRLVELEKPSGLFVFIDEHEDSISGGDFLVSPTPGRAGWADHPASRHSGKGLLSFGDGHTEFRRWLDNRTPQPVTRQRLLGVLAPGSVDLDWLAERTSVIK